MYSGPPPGSARGEDETLHGPRPGGAPRHSEQTSDLVRAHASIRWAQPSPTVWRPSPESRSAPPRAPSIREKSSGHALDLYGPDHLRDEAGADRSRGGDSSRQARRNASLRARSPRDAPP